MELVSKADVSFGGYLPENCIAADSHTRTWLATQLSVGRMVWIEELIANSNAERDAFLADVRAKAAVENPIVGSIYEASADEGIYYYAYELLPGKTLAERNANGDKLSPELIVQVLSKIAEVCAYYDTHQIASSPLGLEQIFIDDSGVIRLKNLATSEERLSDHSLGDMMRLGHLLESLLDTQQAGASRCLTLLAWMRGEDSEHSLSWAEVLDYSLQIDYQLTTPAEIVTKTGRIFSTSKKKLTFITGAMICAALLLILVIPEKSSKPAKILLYQAGWIPIPKGKHEISDHFKIKHTEFSISACEVTIGQYAEFLETLDILKVQNAGDSFDHSEQPEAKKSHIPDDWDALYEAAKNSKVWRKHLINLNTPIVGVDWWDAYAYANWKNAELPTQEQWLGALMSGASDPSEIKISELLPVNEDSPDRTENGLIGMSGSVSEWTSEPRAAPDNPLGKELWVITGGSYLNPNQGALSREWVADRMLRRPDLGFRICQKK
jgi:Sulfatase-modifying factor enzyme 1